jgi:hypothetical protein
MLTKLRSLHDRLMAALLLLQVGTLFVGTLMPGAVRNGVQKRVDASLWDISLPLSSLAHLAIFAGMAFVLYRRPFQWSFWRILLAALALALVSEGLQHFAVDRHPRWLDVGIDISGTLMGLVFGGLFSLCFARR